MLKPIPSEVPVTGRRRKKSGKKAGMSPKIQSRMTIEIKDQKKLMKVVARRMSDFADRANVSEEEAGELIHGLQRSIIMVQKQRVRLIQNRKRK